MYVCAQHWCLVPVEVRSWCWESQEQELQILGIKPGSSGRAVNALNCWAISPISTAMLTENLHTECNFKSITTPIFKRQGFSQALSNFCIFSLHTERSKLFDKRPPTQFICSPGTQHAHTVLQCLPAQGPDRLPEGTRWSRWNPTSEEETPAPAVLSVTAPPDGAPACWGGIAFLQSLIYRYIFLSHHTAVTQSPGDCSHKAHRIASLGPTRYWALKPNGRENKETKQNDHMVLFKR